MKYLRLFWEPGGSTEKFESIEISKKQIVLSSEQRFFICSFVLLRYKELSNPKQRKCFSLIFLSGEGSLGIGVGLGVNRTTIPLEISADKFT